MFLTLEYLEQNNACEKGKKWFAKYYPNGAELIDIMRHRTVRFAPEFLHWGYNNLATSPEEQAVYWEVLKVDCERKDTIFESDNLTNCEYVSQSSRVVDSNHIFSSKKIKNSSEIVSSTCVENSKIIYASDFVYDSSYVLTGKNITNSLNIINSNNVFNSENVANCSQVSDSYCVVGTDEKTNSAFEYCYFVTRCNNLKNCIFCADLQDKEYYVFNRQVSEQQFLSYQKQLKDLLEPWQAAFVKEWPNNQVLTELPEKNLPWKYYKHLPEIILLWAKTLPGYDDVLFAKIIMSNDFMGIDKG